MTSFTVVTAGWATTVQDLGRPGHAALGVPTSGAVDPTMHSLVNRLVGNPVSAPVLETAGGLTIRADGPLLVATSAELAAVSVQRGATVDVRPHAGETWGYLAVRGGLRVEPVLGSASHDTLSGLGPPPVVDGDLVFVHEDPTSPLVVDQSPPPRRPQELLLWPGPRLDWFADGAFAQLARTPWTVSEQTSRVGVRLDGEVPRRTRHDELAPEGLVLGAIQVPPDGRPVVMLADHPTTGGYPVIGIVDPSDVGHLAQRRPGSVVRFRVSPPV